MHFKCILRYSLYSAWLISINDILHLPKHMGNSLGLNYMGNYPVYSKHGENLNGKLSLDNFDEKRGRV